MKKFIMVVVMVALFAGAVGVGVHVMHRDALAANYPVQLQLNWNGFTESNCFTTARLLDVNGDQLDAIALTPDSHFSTWTGTLVGDATEAVSVEFLWIEGIGGEDWWEDNPPVELPISLPLTILATTAH